MLFKNSMQKQQGIVLKLQFHGILWTETCRIANVRNEQNIIKKGNKIEVS